jgi:DNA-binding transcriptional MerR regulator
VAKAIPNKLFFKIGEVCELLEVEAYVLRFWETEFPSLAPQKSKAGHRVYRRKDVEKIMKVKELLYERGFTIAGARKELSAERAAERGPERANAEPDAPERARVLSQIRKELRDILTLLKRKT